MPDLEDKIIAFKVTEEEYGKLEALADMLYRAKRLPKPTVNTAAKFFTFVVYNQFSEVQTAAGAQSG